jgi:hypothetical protein
MKNLWRYIAAVGIIASAMLIDCDAEAQYGPCYVGGRPCYSGWMMPRYCGWYGTCRNWVGSGPWGYPVSGYWPNWRWRW